MPVLPQGSIMGPLLFIIFMNNMALEDRELDMYADDSTLTATGKTIETLDNNLNSDMESIVAWCGDNRMVVNTDKTTIRVTGKTIEEQESKLNIDLKNVQIWCQKTRMAVNAEKN